MHSFIYACCKLCQGKCYIKLELSIIMFLYIYNLNFYVLYSMSFIDNFGTCSNTLLLKNNNLSTIFNIY